MGRVIVQMWMTADGVVQAPGDPQEDTRGGFQHGGWSLPYFDEAAQRWVLANLNGVASQVTTTGAILATYAPAEE